jgi:hypothetical protein
LADIEEVACVSDDGHLFFRGPGEEAVAEAVVFAKSVDGLRKTVKAWPQLRSPPLLVHPIQHDSLDDDIIPWTPGTKALNQVTLREAEHS